MESAHVCPSPIPTLQHQDHLCKEHHQAGAHTGQAQGPSLRRGEIDWALKNAPMLRDQETPLRDRGFQISCPMLRDRART